MKTAIRNKSIIFVSYEGEDKDKDQEAAFQVQNLDTEREHT